MCSGFFNYPEDFSVIAKPLEDGEYGNDEAYYDNGVDQFVEKRVIQKNRDSPPSGTVPIFQGCDDG